MSNGSLRDEVTNLNVIGQTVGYSSKYFSSALKFVISLMMGSGRAPLVVTKPVRELLFEGYDDPLLTLIRANGNPDIPKVMKKSLPTSTTLKNIFLLLAAF